VFASLLASLLLAIPAAQPPSPRLAVIGDAPDFTLIDQDGQKVKRSDFQGDVLLVSFIFTTCNGTCPATTHRMAKVHQVLDKQLKPPSQQGVVFLSLTLDPQRDTPEAFKKYIQLYDLQTQSNQGQYGKQLFRWRFLTGSPDTVAKTIAAWGMWVKPAPNGQLDHPSRIFLVDPQGKIREIYNVDLLRREVEVGVGAPENKVPLAA
jgi:protein SCO1/2